MKRSIYISLTVFIGIMCWTFGEAVIFGSAMNANESAIVGFVYFLLVLFFTTSICKDIHYRLRPRHASKLDQSIDLSDIVSDDLYMATNERLG